jgi:hypothetical protein
MAAATRHDFIFAHEGDVRVAASVVVIGMLAVLIGGAFMAIGPRLNHTAGARNAAGAGSPAPVRVVGATPRGNNVACEQQVWPDIDQRCLVRADSKAPVPAEAKTAASVAPPAAQENDKLSPLTAASVDHSSPPEDDATAGSGVQGVQEDTALLRQTAPINVTASPDVDDDDVDEAPPPVEQPRRREHRPIGLPFHLRFGGFRF